METSYIIYWNWKKYCNKIEEEETLPALNGRSRGPDMSHMVEILQGKLS